MCGIVGVLRFGADSPEKQLTKEAALYFATTLLDLTETRGKEATGVVALYDNGNFFGQKMGISASSFISRFGGKESDFDGLMEVMRKYDDKGIGDLNPSGMRTFLGHCRKKSVGSVADNVNNHPIKVGNIVGIHNGTLRNHEEIFKNLNAQRDGEVDSEAIFRLMSHYTKSAKEPFTLDLMVEVAKRLEGTFSVLAFNANNPKQVVSFRDGRPAEYCLIKPLKLVLIASEKIFINAAICQYNKMAYLFNHGNLYRKLKASDVEFGELKDDTIALFDLTKEVTDETKLESLFETRAIPKAYDRIWKAATTTTVYSNGYNRTVGYQTPTSEEKKTTPVTSTPDSHPTSTTDSTKKSTLNVIGRVWNDRLDKYVEAFGKIQGNEGNVIVDIEKKTVTPLDEAIKNEKAKDSEQVTADPQELNTSATPVENFNKEEKVSIHTVSPVDNSSLQLLTTIQDQATAGKTVSQDELDSSKAAIESAKTLVKFKDNAEVATLCNTTEMGLEQLPMWALANRILKSQFCQIFKAGFIAKCELDKKEKTTGQRHVRILKKVITLCDHMFAAGGEQSKEKTSNWLKTHLASEALSEVSIESLSEVFNAGDFRNNNILKSMASTLATK